MEYCKRDMLCEYFKNDSTFWEYHFDEIVKIIEFLVFLFFHIVKRIWVWNEQSLIFKDTFLFIDLM